MAGVILLCRRRHRRASLPGRGAGAGAEARGWRVHLATDHRVESYGHDFPGRGDPHHPARRRSTRSPVAAARALLAARAAASSQARRLIGRIKPAVGGRLRRLSDRAADARRGAARGCRRSSTSRTPCSAAPTGSSRRASRAIATSFAEVGGAEALAAADRRRPAIRSARPCARRPRSPYPARARRRPVPPSRLRRQPGRALHVRPRAAGDRSARPRTLRAGSASSQQCRPEDIDRVARGLSSDSASRPSSQPFFRDLPARIAGEPSRRLPLRRLDRRRARRHRPAGDHGAAAACARPGPEGQCRGARRRRRRLDDRAARHDAGAACRASSPS